MIVNMPDQVCVCGMNLNGFFNSNIFSLWSDHVLICENYLTYIHGSAAFEEEVSLVCRSNHG